MAVRGVNRVIVAVRDMEASREDDSVISPFLEANGEGVVDVVIAVDDTDAAAAKADRAGVESVLSVDYTQAEIDAHLDGLFGVYSERFLNTAETCGFAITLGHYEPKGGGSR